MIGNDQTLIVTIMKNEGPYILEWVAHHMAVGFDGFLIFTNDCDDLTDRILERLERLVPVFHRPNPKALLVDQGNWLVMALRYARYFNVYRDAGWIYHTDVDEFLFIKPGAGRLDDFHEAAGAFDVVSFTSMPFNSYGIKRFEDRFVTQQFLQHSKPYSSLRAPGSPPVANAVKTLYRNAVTFDTRRNHRPVRRDFSASGLRWIDGSGNPLGPEFVDGEQKSTNPLASTDLAQFNHYAIKSAESFLVKVERGDAADASRLRRSRRYWRGYDSAGDDAPEFARTSPAVLAAHAELMADPLLREMHEESVAKHKAKARRILASPLGAGMAGWLGLSEV